VDFKPLVSGMELLDKSEPLRKLLWGCIFVAGLYVLLFGAAAVIESLGRWGISS